MTQYNFGTIDPYVVDGIQLAGMLNNWRDAIHSWHRGPTRPSYAVPGMMWINDSGGATSWVVTVFMGGGVDVPLFTYNTTTGSITIAAGGGGFTSNLISALGLTPTVAWNKTDNAIDVKRWQATVNVAGALVLSSLTDAGVVVQSFTFNRDGTLSTSGTTRGAFNVRATVNDILSGSGSLLLFRSPNATPVKDYDPDNAWTLATSQFAAPVAGRYSFTCHAYLAPSAAMFAGLIMTHRNAAGTGVIRTYGQYQNADQNNYGTGFDISQALQMATGERIDFQMVCPSAGQQLSAITVGGAAVAQLVWASGQRIGN